jgi:hypothetical protein
MEIWGTYNLSILPNVGNETFQGKQVKYSTVRLELVDGTVLEEMHVSKEVPGLVLSDMWQNKPTKDAPQGDRIEMRLVSVNGQRM